MTSSRSVTQSQVGPWKTDWTEMAKKTAFRRVSKWLPLSAEIYQAFAKDGEITAKTQQIAETPSAEEFEKLLSEPEIVDEIPDLGGELHSDES